MLKGSFTCAGGASVLVVAVVCALAFSARTISAFSITAAPVRRSAFGRPYVRSSYSRNGRTVLFMAQGGKKKRRRRRKDASVAESFSDLDDAKGLDEEAKEELDLDNGELPDFDWDDEPTHEPSSPLEAAADSAQAITAFSSVNSEPSVPTLSNGIASMDVSSVDMTDPKVLEAMKGSAKSPTSTDDLLRNRELERAFKFNDSDVKEDLPSLADVRTPKSSVGPMGSAPDVGIGSNAMGKKARRAEARRAAAIEADLAKQEEGGGNFLKNFESLLGEDGEVSGVKVLETGAWAGIGFLVVWEIFINSPFFTRAAPLVPVVYDLLL